MVQTDDGQEKQPVERLVQKRCSSAEESLSTVGKPSVTQVHRSAQPYLYWTCVYRWELLTVSRRDWHEANRQQIRHVT